MPKYQVFHPDHEATGRTMLSYQNAIDNEKLRYYFEKHHLIDLNPDAWYPEQSLLDVFNEMTEQGGATLDFVSVGLKMAENAVLPEEFNELPLSETLQRLGSAHHLNARGTDIGEIKAEVIDNKHVKLTLRLCQPDDLWYGIIYGYVRRFIPKGTHFTVRYEEGTLRRDQGGEVTVIHVTWE